MRNVILIVILILIGGIGYAAAPSTAPATQPSEPCSCCCMKMMRNMQGGMGKMMGGPTPATQPAAGTPNEHAAHQH